MSPQQAKQTVLVSMLALVAIAAFKDKGLPPYKRVWATGVIGVILSVVADFAPQIAGPFAALVVLGSLTNGGDQAIQNLLGGATGSSSSTGKTYTATPSATTPGQTQNKGTPATSFPPLPAPTK